MKVAWPTRSSVVVRRHVHRHLRNIHCGFVCAEELIHVRPGQDVELAFKSRPGQLFHGKVENIIEATGEGQFTPGGKLPSAAQVGSPGFLAVKIRLSDEAQAAVLALGTPAAVAIYTDWGKPFALISKVAIRMQKWLYFLPLPPKQ